MAVVFRMSSLMQADGAVILLLQIGVAARVLPFRPTDVSGQRLEVDVDHMERAAALEIIRQVDPAAHEQGAAD